ncbi:MAG: hypothetical protein ACON4N_11475, partial [Myxococcota bacterium]
SCAYGSSPGVAQGSLAALQDVRVSQRVGINLFAHMERGRIETLVTSGMSFADAALQAHQELTTAVGFDTATVTATELDLFGSSPDDAALVVLSAGANVFGQPLSAALQEVADDLAPDGVLDVAQVARFQAAARAMNSCAFLLPVAECLEAHVESVTPGAFLDVDAARAAADTLLDTCVGGHVTCHGDCVSGEDEAAATKRVAAWGACLRAYTCDRFSWDWQSLCSEPPEDPYRDYASAYLCGEEHAYVLWGSTGALVEGAFELNDLNDPLPKSPMLLSLFSALGMSEDEFLGLVGTVFGAKVSSVDELCVDLATLGDGVCNPLVDQGYNYDLGDCLGGPAVDPEPESCAP